MKRTRKTRDKKREIVVRCFVFEMEIVKIGITIASQSHMLGLGGMKDIHETTTTPT